jgi:predicted PurR-regulated permease PerM
MKFLPEYFWIKLIFFSIIFLLLFLSFSVLKLMLVPIVVGSLLAFLLEPLVSKLEGRGLPRAGSISILFGAMTVILVILWAFATPVVLKEVRQFREKQDYYKEFALEKYDELKVMIETKIPNQVPWSDLEERTESLSLSSGTIVAEEFIKFVAGSTEAIFSFIIIVPLLCFFILKDGLAFKKWLIEFVPNKYFELTMEVLHNINMQTGAFLRGQILDSLMNAGLVSFSLYLIGLPYWLLVGTFAGIANAIPFVGPLTAGSIGVAVAIVSGSPSPFLVLFVFVVCHLIDVMYIYPKTVGHSLNLHELIVIFGIILGGQIGGVLGMLVIIPILGILIRSTQVMYRLLKGYNIL